MREIVRLKYATVFADGETLYVGERLIDPAEPTGLIPLLEAGPNGLPASTLDELPLNQVLALALGWPTGNWWQQLAVDWLAVTGVSPDLVPALEEFAHSKRGTQATRHAARRILKADGPPPARSLG